MAQTKSPGVAVLPTHTHSLRLTFAYKGDKLDLVNTERLNMKTPAAVAPPPGKSSLGYWLEIRDAQGKLLYHQILHDPLRKHVEIYSDAPRQPGIRRVERPDSQGEFAVLVPDVPDARTFTLYGNPARSAPVHGRAKAIEAQSLAKFSFDRLRSGTKPPS